MQRRRASNSLTSEPLPQDKLSAASMENREAYVDWMWRNGGGSGGWHWDVYKNQPVHFVTLLSRICAVRGGKPSNALWM